MTKPVHFADPVACQECGFREARWGMDGRYMCHECAGKSLEEWLGRPPDSVTTIQDFFAKVFGNHLPSGPPTPPPEV